MLFRRKKGNETPKHLRNDDIIDFGRGKVQLQVGDNEYIADILIGRRSNNELVFYDIINLHNIRINKKRASTSERRWLWL